MRARDEEGAARREEVVRGQVVVAAEDRGRDVVAEREGGDAVVCRVDEVEGVLLLLLLLLLRGRLFSLLLLLGGGGGLGVLFLLFLVGTGRVRWRRCVFCVGGLGGCFCRGPPRRGVVGWWFP